MAARRQYEELARQLSAIGAVKRGLGRVLPHECPAGSAAVLTLLDRHGEMRMSRLAELLAIDMSVTSRHVAHVAERGWIDRSPDPADKRSRILRLTPAGQDMLAELSERYMNALVHYLADWSDDEVDQLNTLLGRLRTSFGDCRPVSAARRHPPRRPHPPPPAPTVTPRRTDNPYTRMTHHKKRKPMATTTPAGVRGSHAKHGGAADGAPMTHRQIMEALSGLLLGMFVAILSSTIVTNALPEIIGDLGGGQSAYTWVVTAALLSMTAATPLWGKLADLYSKKALVQIALVIYVLGSAAAGLSQNPGMLIACRVVQGIGVGGLSALAQIVMAAMISPRERGRYSGYLGATFAVATVGGPLLGGVITDTSWLGWRWCFYVGVPFAVIALIVLQKTLHLPVVKRDVKVDWGGAFLISAAVSLLLVWVTFAGDKYEWVSWQTYAMVGGAVALGLLFVLVESKAKEPIIPLRLFRNRTITLSSLASLFVGVAMFSGTVFFSQYFQLARDKSPTMSGVMTIPMIGGLFISSTVSGQIITKTGQVEGLAGQRRCPDHRGARSAGHHPVRHGLLADRRLHGAAGSRHRHDDAEPGAVHAEPGGAGGPRLGQLHGDLLPLPRRRDRRLRAGCGDGQPDHRLRQGRPDRARPQVRGRCGRFGTTAASRTWTRCPRRCARSWRARTATASRTSS